VIYVGDTVGDMYVVQQARRQDSSREWIGVGVLPPHAQTDTENRHRYTEKLQQAGAAVVLEQVLDLTPDAIEKLIADNDAKSANQNHI
jgi:HAD superfamily phosphatase